MTPPHTHKSVTLLLTLTFLLLVRCIVYYFLNLKLLSYFFVDITPLTSAVVSTRIFPAGELINVHLIS